MIKIVAERDSGWFDYNTDKTLYGQTAKAYGVEFQLVAKLSSIQGNIIVFDEDGDVTLDEFVHPEDGIYVFGRSGQDIKPLFPNARVVRINTPNEIPLFGHVAAGIVLEDRRRKWQSQ